MARARVSKKSRTTAPRASAGHRAAARYTATPGNHPKHPTPCCWVLAIGFLVWLLTRVAIRPIDNMIGVASAIGGGDLRARIDLKPSSTEVVRLAAALQRHVDPAPGRLRRQRAVGSAVAPASPQTPPTNCVRRSRPFKAGPISTRPAALSRRRCWPWRWIASARETERMASLVEDLLLLARLDQHRPLDYEPIDLAAVVAGSVADLRTVQPGRPNKCRPSIRARRRTPLEHTR